jgi:hypothetical protein
VLVAVTLLACLPAALLGNWLYGRPGVWAALAAAGLCVAGSVLGLVVVTLLQSSLILGQQAFGVVLAAMLPRMFVPLAGAVVLRLNGGPLYEAGALYFVIGFYLLTLAAETLWLLPPGGFGDPVASSSAHLNSTPLSRTEVPSQSA